MKTLARWLIISDEHFSLEMNGRFLDLRRYSPTDVYK